MNNSLRLKQSLVLAAILACPLAQAATMATNDYKAAKTNISATYKAEKRQCASLTANAKDICIEEAKAKDKVARAELEYARSGSIKDENKVQVAKAEATYAVAKEKCDDLAGNAKDVCVKEAKAVEVHALSDAKVGTKVNAAINDAAKDVTNAEYKLAAEKCESMSGDAKASCMVNAKSNAGKN